jgi:peptidoglycan/xylan/chitin deacetylase (PgdA/CDA1 family)
MPYTNNGKFVISLDFELHWGVFDIFTVAQYQENLDNTRWAIDGMLSLFERYNIHATWATVGFLFCDSKEEILSLMPDNTKPQYKDGNLSPYLTTFPNIGNNELEDKYHYAPSVVKKIQAVHGQELATHTFSHYYCLEEGQTIQSFEADLKAAITVAKKYQANIDTIIFPRNQYSKDYLKVCEQLGITSFRGCEDDWASRTSSLKEKTLLKRGLRFIDSFIPILGETWVKKPILTDGVYNIPSNRFFRPYRPNQFQNNLRLDRIKKSMLYAAKNGYIYHLWWHPHNFGQHTQGNLDNLEIILQHFCTLQDKYNMCSLNMKEIVDEDRKRR